MASLRGPRRADGTGFAVLYKLDWQQTSTTFDHRSEAGEFRDDIKNLGVDKGHEVLGKIPSDGNALRGGKRD